MFVQNIKECLSIAECKSLHAPFPCRPPTRRVAGNGHGPHKDSRPAASPDVVRKVFRLSRKTAEHDLGRNAPEIEFRGFVLHAEDFFAT